MSNPVLTGTDVASWPVSIPAGGYSPWITAQGYDSDAQTVTAQIVLKDANGNSSNVVTAAFNLADPLRVEVTFASGTPALVEIDPSNPLRFRVKNTNA